MALTKAQVREILSEAGVDAEHMRDAVDKIVDGHVASVNALREEADNLRADAGKLEGVQKELDELKAKVAADAKERKGKDYDALKAEYDNYKQEQEQAKHKAEVTDKFTTFLKEMNVSEAGISKILKWRGVQDVDLDEDGKLANARELRKSIKEDWPEYITTETVQGAQTPNPPPNAGSAAGKSREEILAIKDDAELVRAIESNPAVFGLA